jgi:uncharacterized protein YukE
MPIIGETRIKVDTPTLINKAEETNRSISKMEECLEQLETIINRTSYYWIGEAGDKHRKIYYDYKDEIGVIIKRLREHPKDLLEIGQVYSTAEKDVHQMSKELPGDIIT